MRTRLPIRRCSQALGLALGALACLVGLPASAQVEIFAGAGAAVGSRTVLFEGGRYHVCFSTGSEVACASSHDGATFSAPASASAGSPPTHGFSVARWASGLGLAWGNQDQADGSHRLYYRAGTFGPSITWGPATLVSSSPDLRGLQPQLAFTQDGRPLIAAIEYGRTYAGTLSGCGNPKSYRPVPYLFDGSQWVAVGACRASAPSQAPASLTFTALGDGRALFGSLLPGLPNLATGLLDPRLGLPDAAVGEVANLISDATTSASGQLSSAADPSAPTRIHHLYRARSGAVGYALQDASDTSAGAPPLASAALSPEGRGPALSRPASAAGCFTAMWIEGASLRRSSFQGSALAAVPATTVFDRPSAPEALSLEAVSDAPALVWAEAGRVLFAVPSGGASPTLAFAPPNPPADGATSVAVTTAPFLDACGHPIPGGALVTVSSSAASILDGDADPALPGVQIRARADGSAAFGLRAPGLAVTSRVAAMPSAGGPSALGAIRFGAPGPDPHHVRIWAAGSAKALACGALATRLAVVSADGTVIAAPTRVTVCAQDGSSATVLSTTLSDAQPGGRCASGTLPASGIAEVVWEDRAAEVVLITGTQAGLPGAPESLPAAWEPGPVDPKKTGFAFDEGARPELTARWGTLDARVTPRDACGVLARAEAAEVALSVDAPLAASAPEPDPARPGTFVSTVTLPTCPTDSAPLRARASVAGQPVRDAAGAVVLLEVLPACPAVDPARSTVTVSPGPTSACWSYEQMNGAVPAGLAAGHAVLEVTPLDAQARPLPPGQAVVVAQEPPALFAGPVSERPDGTYRALVGADLCGARQLSVSVGGVVLQERPTVTFSCPPAATAALTASPDTLPPDGNSPAMISAEVLDRCGNPASGRPLSLSTTLGSLAAPLATDDRGRVEARLTSGVAGSAVVSGAVDGAPLEPAQVTFAHPDGALALEVTLAPAGSGPQPGSRVQVVARLFNAAPYSARGLRLRLAARGLALDDEVLPANEVPAGGALELRTAGAVVPGFARLEVEATAEDSSARRISGPALATLEAIPLRVDAGCGCGRSGAGPWALAAPAALLLLRRRKSPAR